MHSNEPLPILLRYREAARELGVCERQIYNLVDQNLLEKVKLGSKDCPYYPIQRAEISGPARHGATNGRLKANGAARAAPFFFVTKTNLTARARAESAEKDEYDLDLCQRPPASPSRAVALARSRRPPVDEPPPPGERPLDGTATGRVTTKEPPLTGKKVPAVLACIAEWFPQAFVPEKYLPHRPLKIGIHIDLKARCPALSERERGAVLRWYVDAHDLPARLCRRRAPHRS